MWSVEEKGGRNLGIRKSEGRDGAFCLRRKAIFSQHHFVTIVRDKFEEGY
jgi:hypothetical protein